MNVYESINQLVGKTPLVELGKYSERLGLEAPLIAKIEALNPRGSVKDRAALAMIEDAERRGLLREGTTLIEPTSGNTGVSLAAICASRGYRLVLTMPETMSEERRKLLAAFGAELVLTDGAGGMPAAIAAADELAKSTPNSLLVGQFVNMANPEMHKRTTGPEIWADTDGKLNIFVGGVGTGGTISGVGEFLKSQDARIQVVAVEPAGSAVLSGGGAGAHGIQGIGAGYIPQTLDMDVVDEIVAVADDAAFSSARLLAKTEGFLAGISSGAALWAATELARRTENKGKRIVVLLPDTGERYLSTELFS